MHMTTPDPTGDALKAVLDSADAYVLLTKDYVNPPPVALAWNTLRIAVLSYRGLQLRQHSEALAPEQLDRAWKNLGKEIS